MLETRGNSISNRSKRRGCAVGNRHAREKTLFLLRPAGGTPAGLMLIGLKDYVAAFDSRRDVTERDAYGWNRAGAVLVVAREKNGA